jgi:hypothetical protein
MTLHPTGRAQRACVGPCPSSSGRAQIWLSTAGTSQHRLVIRDVFFPKQLAALVDYDNKLRRLVGPLTIGIRRLPSCLNNHDGLAYHP